MAASNQSMGTSAAGHGAYRDGTGAGAEGWGTGEAQVWKIFQVELQRLCPFAFRRSWQFTVLSSYWRYGSGQIAPLPDRWSAERPICLLRRGSKPGPPRWWLRA